MAEPNGTGEVTAEEAIASAHEADPSLNGHGPGPAPAAAERPEVLIGAAVLGGLLLAGMVSRLGK